MAIHYFLPVLAFALGILDAQVKEFARIAHRDVVHGRTPFIDVGGTTVPRGRLVPGSSSQLSTPTLDKMRQRSR